MKSRNLVVVFFFLCVCVCKRTLTPFCKMGVIKLLAVSKIVYLMLCLPDPPSKFLKDLNTILFKFLWNGKPDRIKRTTVQGEYQRGGLKMVDIFSFYREVFILSNRYNAEVWFCLYCKTYRSHYQSVLEMFLTILRSSRKEISIQKLCGTSVGKSNDSPRRIPKRWA